MVNRRDKNKKMIQIKMIKEVILCFSKVKFCSSIFTQLVSKNNDEVLPFICHLERKIGFSLRLLLFFIEKTGK